ncbi:MAG: type III-B CRISPR module-associated protein Cmr5 [Candidatus Xenobia bacterium]
MITREQQRARKAFELTSSIPEGEREKYGSFVLSMPIVLRTAGLVGALEFAQHKHPLLVRHLQDHMEQAGLVEKGGSLRERAHKATLGDYMRLTREVQAVLAWHKRFAHSILKAEAGGHD